MRSTGRTTILAGLFAAVMLVNAAPASAQPANDSPANAVVIGALPFTDSVITTDTAPDAEAPSNCGLGHTVWYQFTPSADATLTADTFGSDFDTVLAVYVDEPGLEIDCNDDSGSLQSMVTFQVTAGTTYFFQVGGCCSSGGETGTLNFAIAESQPSHGADLYLLRARRASQSAFALFLDRPVNGEPTPGVVYTNSFVFASNDAVSVFEGPPLNKSTETTIGFSQSRYTFDSEGNEIDVSYSFPTAIDDVHVTVAKNLSSASATGTMTLETCFFSSDPCQEETVSLAATWSATGRTKTFGAPSAVETFPGSSTLILGGPYTFRPATASLALDGTSVPGHVDEAQIANSINLTFCVDLTGGFCGG